MNDTTIVEARLRSLFGAIAAQVDDLPSDLGSFLREDSAGCEVPDIPERVTPPKLGRGAIAGGIAGGAIVLVGAVAAAAGALPFSLSAVLGTAGSIIGANNPPAAAHAILRVVSPGPDETTLKVFSALTSPSDVTAGSCWSLAIDSPTGVPAPGSVTADKGACSIIASQTTALTPQQQEQASHGGQAVSSWYSPSGTLYTIVFGEGVPGTAYVALTDAAGKVGAKVATSDSWFAIYISQSAASTYNRITFLNTSGAVLTTLPGIIASSPPA